MWLHWHVIDLHRDYIVKVYDSETYEQILSHPYQLLGTFNDVCASLSKGLVELSNGHIAASHYVPNCIYIANPNTYKLITNIVDKEYITDCGGLCMYSVMIYSLLYLLMMDVHVR